MKYLNGNITPDNLKRLSTVELSRLCAEIRRFLIKTVSETGGHLASNLGTVELIVALHRVYSSPRDKFVFDVGHQAYTHKLLTGRLERFNTLREENGLSGFPRPSESEHDAFIGGHSGISVSAALGLAEAMRLSGDKHKVIAVAGDGAFTNGGVYEGLNNAGKSRANILIILNNNEMSISRSAGAVSAYLSRLRATRKYYRAKLNVKGFLGKTQAGEAVKTAISRTKRIVKNVIYQGNLFENLGFKYYGSVDGHNLTELTEVLELAKMIDSPCLIHVKTKKGKGYKPAEHNSGEYHGLDKVKSLRGRETFSEVFGREILALGKNDEKICLISAAMKHATGCNYFNNALPERFFDCGIAESHAVTFACGLAAQGMLPVFAVYSTFSQRCFDRLIHDAAIENLRVVLAIDRAGVVGEDGETHQGVFDVAMLSLIPNFTVFSPASPDELRDCLRRALYEVSGPAAVRYPRGSIPHGRSLRGKIGNDFRLFKKRGNKKLIITYGRTVHRLVGGEADTLQLIKIHPLSDGIIDVIKGYKDVVFVEEGIKRGGVGEFVASELLARGWKGKYAIRAYNGFVPAADTEKQLSLILSADTGENEQT
ncbi:MAG: 1-deoxy-D-xylulose-5-phosphate synthase [Oscillospiraceae bacterium]|jgi:1-deoxy-D-xylulose-5-phosphate synthase|nr:1-deoxy-D-xylulose-5-phosphate synthase [Oscillospiraceae bacterium]